MKDFWQKRWHDSNIPWHQTEPHPLLVKFFPKSEKRNVFVPLCGKSVDLAWLSENGSRVVGAELSEIACRDFFVERKKDFEIKEIGSFKKFIGDKIEVWCGDIFELSVDSLGTIDFIFDRAALYALPPGKIRNQYAELMTKIAIQNSSQKFEMLLIGREAEPPIVEGPPYMMYQADISALYDRKFKIEFLDRLQRPPRADIHSVVSETAYRLKVVAT